MNKSIKFFAFLGYFWYDLCDIISNRRGLEASEILLHHVLVSISLL